MCCGDKIGTKTGYNRHRAAGERACDPCRKAMNATRKTAQCGSCGKPVVRVPTSRPVITCHDCRRIESCRTVAELECCICGKGFVRFDWWKCPLSQPACSISCARRLRAWREGRTVTGREAHRKARCRARRAAKAMTWDGVPDDEIINRDGWRCQMPVCLFRSRAIPRTAKYPDPRYKSVDHIIPLSVEPDDTSANKRAAHLRCNMARGNRMVDAEQPPLFGTVRDLPVMTMAGGKRLVVREPKPPRPKPVRPLRPCRSCGVLGAHVSGAHAPGCLRLLTDEQRQLLAVRMAAMHAEGILWAAISEVFGYKGSAGAYIATMKVLSTSAAA